jgi:hypothetical protein
MIQHPGHLKVHIPSAVAVTSRHPWFCTQVHIIK